MELSTCVPLDLPQSCLGRQAWTVRPVGGHRIEAVGDDQEVRRERQLVSGNTVVAASVDALVVQLDRARLRSDELEALQEPRREPRMTAHRRPFRSRSEE